MTRKREEPIEAAAAPKESQYEAPEVETVMNREEIGRDVQYAANTFSDTPA